MVRWLAVAAIGCSGGGGGDKAPGNGSGCPPVDDGTVTLVVTDIDETLTTLDTEWLAELADPSHDPAMRPDANTLMQGYDNQGFGVVYVTARGEDLALADGTTARDATEGWLDEHGFPYSDDRVHLAEGLGASGDAAVTYKAGVVADLQGAGHEVVYAYGNADSDIEAYQQSGIPDDHIFLVGKNAGQLGVVGITDADAYTAHLPFLDGVGCGH